MRLVTYIQEAVNPGGTPRRYLVWVSFVLIAQVLASILPSPHFRAEEFNLSHGILIGGIIIPIVFNFVRTDKQRIFAAYFLYIIGLIISTVTISIGITSLSGIVFMLTWAMTLFVAERREYISFDLVVVFMVLMLISTFVLLMFNPESGVADNMIILITGAVLTAIDIYLVYADFGYERNYYQESRRTYSNLEILSSKLSDILSSDGQLESILWKVTEECVPFLDLEECVIYLYDPERNKLVQVSAFGAKLDEQNEIVNPIEIDPGHGIVGKCFSQAKAILVEETRNHPDYIVDDAHRDSELAVPILSNGKAIGVIDSEHRLKGFFKERHVQAFHIMASFCGIKITENQARESIQQAAQAKQEAIRYKELDELKNRFITNISHDLKTPLSLIKAPAMQIQNATKSDQVKKHASYILKNADHLLRVVNQLLQLNRVDLGLNELYVEEIEIDKLIGKIATQYSGLAEKDNIQFIVNTDSAVIVTDAFRLEQIIHNLVHNAFRYSGKGGKVELTVQHQKDSLRISVIDNGPGISKDTQTKVFDRFFKADENNHEGTGIGLSLVKEYAESLGGKVELASEPGNGSNFQVTLPATNTKAFSFSESSPDADELSIGNKPLMLVVEDHADLNDFICGFFDEDYQCISAFDGEEALIKMNEQIPDIIISDLMMPKMNGNTFIETIKSSDNWGHIPVIVLSAKSQVDSRINLYELGADNYLVKPFDIQELSSVVKNVLDQRQKLKQRFQQNYLPDTSVSEEKTVISEENKKQHELLQQAVDFVMERIDDSDLSIKYIAESLGIGRNKFQREIKELTGLKPVEFVRSIRLNEARRMLNDQSLNVSEVAYAVGFNNLSYFTRSFKSEFGILPSDWQKEPMSS